MEKKSFLPDVFSIIGNLFTAVVVFIGLIYTLNGNIWLSGFICLVLMILNYVFPERLAFFKSRKIKNPQNWQEYTILFFYVLIALGVFLIGTHFINIDIFNKDNVKKSGEDKILRIEQLKTDYTNEIDHKKSILDTKANNFYQDYVSAQLISDSFKMHKNIDSLNALLSTPGKTSYNSVDLINAITSKKQIIEASLNLDQFQTDNNFTNRIQESKDVIENWKFLKLNYSYKELDSLNTILYNEAKTKIPEFEPSATEVNEFNLSNPIKSLTNGNSSAVLLSALILIVLNLCILAPYINTKRYQSGLSSGSSKKYQGPSGIEL